MSFTGLSLSALKIRMAAPKALGHARILCSNAKGAADDAGDDDEDADGDADDDAAPKDSAKRCPWQRAAPLLHVMRREGPPRNVIRFRAVISACEKRGQWQGAVPLLYETRREVGSKKLTLLKDVVRFIETLSGRYRLSLLNARGGPAA